MKLIVTLLLGFSLLKSFETRAQENLSGNSEDMIIFDPLFWKDELKLSAGQYNTIQNINREYYQGIFDAIHENEGKEVLQTIATDLLRERSTKIWRTFQPKQKRRWSKLAAVYAGSPDKTSSAFILRAQPYIIARGR
jgi:hypothetical protein